MEQRDSQNAPNKIAARRMAEQELRDSEQRYRILVEMLPDAVVVHADDHFLYANPAALRLYGATSLEQLQTHGVLELVHPDDRDFVQSRVQSAHHQRTLVREERLWRLNGQIVPVEASGQNIVYQGRPAVQAVLCDLSQRRRSEESLQQADLRHRRFLETIPVGVMRWTGERLLVDANDSFLHMLGYNREELHSGRLLLPDLTPEAYRESSDQAFAELLARGVCGPFEKAYRHRDGHVVPVLVSSVICADGDGPEAFSFVVDLTAQKRVEQALRESEQRLRLHLENTTLGVIELDARFTVTGWSGQAERIFGWSIAETLGQPLSDLHIIYHEDVPVMADVMRQLTDGTTRQRIALSRNCTKDGRMLHCRWYNSALVDEHGRLSSVLSLIEDCTATVQAEQMLRDAKQQAEDANAAKRRFLASMSHEMRTPLTAIVGFADLLAAGELAPQTQRQYLDAVDRNAQMLLKLVDHVLDFSKIESGRMQLQLVDCSLGQILQDVLAATRLEAEQERLQIELACQYPLPDTIRTDPLRLWQILVNLVGHVIKSTNQGGIRIGVALETAQAEQNRLRFTVSDSGSGLPADGQQHVCEPFVPDSGQSARQRGGISLGLPIAAGLAELLATHLEIGPSSPSGTTCSFALDPGPLQDRRMLWSAPDSTAPETCRADRSADRLQGRLLLAEDTTDTQELLRIYLESAGLQVDLASDGLSAVRRSLAATAAGQPYDVILLDLQMPELDGYEAARLLRASAWPGPILALSAHTMSEDRARCREAGFDQFLPKPVSRETLLATIRPYLSAGPDHAASATPSLAQAGPRLVPGANVLDAGRPPVSYAAGLHLTPQPAPAPTATSLEAERDRLLALFTSQLPQRLALLEQGLREQDRTRLAQTAHQLTGAAGQFGFPQIAAAAQVLEQCAAGGVAWNELEQGLCTLRETVASESLTPRATAVPAAPADTTKPRHRVLLADDDQLVRAALHSLVNSLPDFQVVAEAANGREALDRLQQYRPEVVLMDIAMPDLDGLNATAQMFAAAPQTKVVILSAHAREETVLQALHAGAVGYLLKNASPRELEQALSAVVRGATYYCAAVSQHLMATCVPGANAKPARRLTPRQLEVLKRIAEGDSTKMIARKLQISVKTAEHHRANLMKLLDIHETASLVRYAIDLGLVAPDN